MNRKLICGLCALLLVSGAVTSCASDTDDAADTTSASASETASETQTPDTAETAKETEELLYTDAIGKTDFSGQKFRIYTSNNINAYLLPTTINYAEEETGEVVHDTLFARDRWMEETFGVDMEYTVDDTTRAKEMAGRLSKIILAGDDVYDLIIQDIAQVTLGLATANCIYPLNEVDNLRLDQPYWMPELNEQLKFGENLYFAANTISPRFWGSIYLMMFNRDLAADLDINNLYDLVSSGTWTVDKMMDYAKLAKSDLNGDGKMDDNDRYGLIYEILTPESILLGGGFHYVENVGGELKCMLEDTKTIDAMQKLSEYLQDPCVGYDGDPDLNTSKILNTGTSLFYNPVTFTLADFRELPYDYGILPMPKWTEEQKSYIGYSQPWAAACPAVPITVTEERLPMVGTLTDAMVAYGQDYIRPAVFDNVIQLKGTRDEKSAQIIGQVFENITFELASFMHFDQLSKSVDAYFTKDLGKKDIVSVYASIRSTTEAALREAAEQFSNFRLG